MVEGSAAPGARTRLATAWVTPARLLLLGACGVGLGLRVWLATHDDGVYWPDEIYQSLEPAHHLAFGPWLPSWEYVHGARSWLFPGLLAIVLKGTSLVGLAGPRAYLTLVRLLFCGLAVLTAVGCHRLARAHGASPLAAATAGAIFALAGPLIYFAPRALTETASAPLIVFGLALALDGRARPRSVVLGSGLLGLSILFRLQNAILCAALLGILAGRRRWSDLHRATVALAGCLALLGAFDLVTWGFPFRSAITYLAVNAGPEGSSLYGVSPFTYYAQTSLSAFGPLIAALTVLSLIAWRRALGLLLVTASYVLLHSLIGHKELRFLVPVLPLVCATAALGLDALAASVSRAWGRVALAAVLGLASLSAVTFHRLTFGDVGASSEYYAPSTSAYDFAGDINRLMIVAHGRSDLCGLKIESIRLAWSGGYTYLDRAVPLYPPDGADDSSHFYNYVITTPPRAQGRTVVARDGGEVLARLAIDGCEHDPYQ